MKTWLEEELARVSAKSALADAIRYALRHWKGLSLFLGDGRVEIESNTVEYTIRPIKAWRQEPPLRRLRWGRPKLGRQRLVDPADQAQWRRALRLSARCSRAYRFGPDQSQRAELAAALGLEGLTDESVERVC